MYNFDIDLWCILIFVIKYFCFWEIIIFFGCCFVLILDMCYGNWIFVCCIDIYICRFFGYVVFVIYFEFLFFCWNRYIYCVCMDYMLIFNVIYFFILIMNVYIDDEKLVLLIIVKWLMYCIWCLNGCIFY